jgi:hypothetical protein
MGIGSAPDPGRPVRRLRRTLALGGTGLLALGLGVGALQAHGDDPSASPADAALGRHVPETIAPSRSAGARTAGATGGPAAFATHAEGPGGTTPIAPTTPAEQERDLPGPAGGSATDGGAPDPAAPVPPDAGAPAPDGAASPDGADDPAAAPGSGAPEAPAGDQPQPGPDGGEGAAPPPPAGAPATPDGEAAGAAPPADASTPPAGAGAGTSEPQDGRPTPQPQARETTRRCRPGTEEAITLQGGEPVCTPVPGRTRPRGSRDDGATDDRAVETPPLRNAEGVPTIADPTTSIVDPGPVPIGVPNVFIEKFRIPPFLLPIYQAAGMEYGIRWEILAAINEIETDYGRNLNVSSAGAIGWMQFLPSTWEQYGVDANGDGRKDPYNPVDAIFAAARYLRAAGADKDLRRAIYAYNHADWYVDSVLMRARLIGGLPADLVGSLTGLTQGRFPVDGRARYADGIDPRAATRRVRAGNPARPIEPEPDRDGILIFAAEGTPVIAVQDAVVVGRGTTPRLGRFVRIRDAFGNEYTYARLARLEETHPVPKDRSGGDGARADADAAGTPADEVAAPGAAADAAPAKERLFAHPTRPRAYRAGGARQLEAGGDAPAGRAAYAKRLLGLEPDEVAWRRLEPGARIVAGTILGRIGRTSSSRAPHVLFEIRPAGRGAPRIDPKPILDGWKLLEATAIYRAKGRNPFAADDERSPTIGQILLMSKASLQRRVLRNPRIRIYRGGRRDIRAGRIDRRVLATLEFLAANGLNPTVTSLQTGHSLYTSSGRISQHATGTAVDIAAINGIPIAGNQGKGSIADITIRRLLTLQGAMKPHQIISLMRYPTADNTLALGDHHDHIHIGFRPVAGTAGRALNGSLAREQWPRLIDRLNAIENPVVRRRPSKDAIRVREARSARRARDVRSR